MTMYVIFVQGIPGAHPVARGLLLDPRVRPARPTREALGPLPPRAPVTAGRAQGREEGAKEDGVNFEKVCLCGYRDHSL